MRLSRLISMTNFKKALSLASRLVIQFQASDFAPQRGPAHAQFGRRFRRIGALPQHLLDRLLLDLGHLVEPAGRLPGSDVPFLRGIGQDLGQKVFGIAA